MSKVQPVGGALAKIPVGLDDEWGISKAAKPSHPWTGHLGDLSKVSRCFQPLAAIGYLTDDGGHTPRIGRLRAGFIAPAPSGVPLWCL